MLETNPSCENNNPEKTLGKMNLVSDRPELRTQWLPPGELRPALRSISYTWFRHLSSPPSEHLGVIRRGVWEAECGLQPFPDVAVTYRGNVAAGVLSGYRMYGKKYFFVENLALHPSSEMGHGYRMLIAQALITTAMDLSVDMGCYGWLAVTPDDDSKVFWRSLGFYKYDEFTYRKMGYFQS